MDNYNSLATQYHSYEEGSITDWILGLSIIFNEIIPIKNKKILDYGCGTGRFSRFLSKHGGQLIGVDTSQRMIELAKNHQDSKIVYHLIQSGELEFLEPLSIDFVTLNYVLCTISSTDEIENIFKSLHRVLKKNGGLCILDNNWEKSHGREFISHKLDFQNNLNSGQKVGVLLKGNPSFRIEDYFWSKQDYSRMLENAGFSVCSIQEPQATDNDHPWLDEKFTSPSIIITAKK